MALFESYERRIDKINGVLAQYGIGSIEECRTICQDKGFDPYEIVKGIQPICFENACWAYTMGAAIAIKKGVKSAAEASKAIGDGLGHPRGAGISAQDDVDLVGAGDGHQGVHAPQTLLLQYLRPGSVGAYHVRLGQQVFDGIALVLVLLHDLHPDAHAEKLPGQVYARMAAAHDHHAPGALFEDVHGLEEGVDLPWRAHHVHAVAGPQDEVAAGSTMRR